MSKSTHSSVFRHNSWALPLVHLHFLSGRSHWSIYSWLFSHYLGSLLWPVAICLQYRDLQIPCKCLTLARIFWAWLRHSSEKWEQMIHFPSRTSTGSLLPLCSHWNPSLRMIPLLQQLSKVLLWPYKNPTTCMKLQNFINANLHHHFLFSFRLFFLKRTWIKKDSQDLSPSSHCCLHVNAWRKKRSWIHWAFSFG